MTSPLPPELDRLRAVPEREAALIVGLRPGTLANMRSQRRGPAYSKVGRTIVYPVAELLAWRDRVRVVPER